jgi:hypothetical protein
MATQDHQAAKKVRDPRRSLYLALGGRPQPDRSSFP